MEMNVATAAFQRPRFFSWFEANWKWPKSLQFDSSSEGGIQQVVMKLLVPYNPYLKGTLDHLKLFGSSLYKTIRYIYIVRYHQVSLYNHHSPPFQDFQKALSFVSPWWCLRLSEPLCNGTLQHWQLPVDE